MRNIWKTSIVLAATALGIGATGAERVTLQELRPDLDGNGQREDLSVQRHTNGRIELVLSDGSNRTSIVGFAFGKRDSIQVSFTDANHDGLQDIVVSNFASEQQAGSASPALGNSEPKDVGLRPIAYTLVTPREGYPPRVILSSSNRRPLSNAFSLVGDRDNLGFGIGNGPPPCNYFENGGAPDLGIFDRESPDSFEVDQWSHTFQTPGYPLVLALITWEIFSDPSPQATIALDGIVLDYGTTNFAPCGAYPEGGITQVQVLIGQQALIAFDGQVDIVFSEMGDDVAMDASLLWVIGFVPEPSD